MCAKRDENEKKVSSPTNDTTPEPIVDSVSVTPPENAASWKSSWGSVARRAKNCPEKYRKLYLKAVSGRGKQAALKIHCLECMGYKREEVKACPSVACAWYAYRPGVPRTRVNYETLIQE